MSDERLSPRQQRILSDLIGAVGSLRKKVGNLERAQHARLTTIHAGDGTGLQVVDDDGRVVSRIGGKAALNGDPVQVVDGPDPVKPAAPVVESDEPGLVRVELSDVPPTDLRVCRVLASLNPATPGAPVGSLWPGEDTTVVSPSAGVWHVRLQWVTKAGKESELSDPTIVEVEPPVDAQDIQDTLDTAQARLDEYRDNVAAPRFQALETGLSESNDSLENARTRLSAAESTLAPLPGRIESAEENVATAQEEATKAAAAAVEANNRAMTRLANGNFESGLDYWDHSNVELTSTAHSGQQAAQIGGWLRPGSSFPVVPDQIWELSLYYQHDVTVEFQALDGDQRATLSTHHLDGDSTWSDSGALRVTIPADVHMLSFTITGTSAIVDDITLRDVTDVVRLEEAANANRQKAEQAISELAVMRLAVDGEGGLKDRLSTAESSLQDKADSSQLPELETRLSEAFGEGLDEVQAEATRKANEARDTAIKALREYVRDGDNLLYNGSFEQGWDGWDVKAGEIIEDSDAHSGDHVVSVGRPNANDYPRPNWITTEHGRVYLTEYWAKKLPGGTDPQELKIYYQVTRRDGTIVGGYANDSTGAQLRVFAEDMPVDEWVKVSGLVEITQQQAREFRIAPHVYRTGERFHVDDVRLYDITEAYNALQVAEDAAQTAYLDRLVVRDEIVTPETITNRLWADLGVFNRLQAREGWIGGTLLADGAVTAEKIHATRELITKIMGAEWAYIAEQLVVDGELIANHADVISAAIQNLSVTERADLFEAFITTLGAQEAVIDLLIGTEAWIGGTMLKDDTVTTQHIEFTETLVGNIAELLHLVVDRIDVNSLWADQTWQQAGHFGSEDADQQTRVDGTGVTLYRKIDGEFIPAAVFGGGDLHLSFFDDAGNSTGTLTRDGHVSGVESNFQNYKWRGRQLFGRSLQEENIPVIDSLTHKFVARNRRVMGATDGANQEHYGFLPLTFHAVAGMTYEIIVPSIRMWNISEAAIVFAQIHYTTDGRPPVLSDPILGGETIATTANVGSQKIIQHFSRFFDCEEDCEVNLLLAVRTENNATVSRWWHSASSEASTVRMLVRPAGATPPVTGGTRDVTLGNPDLGGGEQFYRTGWTPTWHQAYMGSRKYTGTNQRLLHGYDPANGQRYATHFGGYRNTPGYGGSISDEGQTMNQALDGAFITDGTLTLTGSASTNSAGTVWVQWHTHTSAPDTFVSEYDTRLITSVEITAGQQSVIDLPRVVLDAIQAGTFQGFTLYHPTHDGPWVALHSPESTTYRTRMPMMRLGYVR